MTKAVLDNNFETEVLKADKPVLVDFWADWCAPCKQIAPILDNISTEMQNIEVVKINIDENPETPSKFGVRGIPTLMLFKDGNIVSSKVGALPKDAIKSWLNKELEDNN